MVSAQEMTPIAEVRRALASATDRLVSLLGSHDDLDVPIPRSDWTVGRAIAHLVGWPPVYAEIAAGMRSPVASLARSDMAEDNARRLADISDTDPRRLTRLLLEVESDFLRAADGPGDRQVIFHAGTINTIAGLVGVALGEIVLHGFDIAAALGEAWPIDSAEAGFVLTGYGPGFAETLDRDATRLLTVAYDIDLGANADPYTVRFSDGALSLEAPGDGPTDCSILTDPTAFLLVMSGRMQVSTAAAQGRWSAGGTDAGLGELFPSLFVFP